MVTWKSVIIMAVVLVVVGALYIRLRWHRSPQAYRAMIWLTALQALRDELHLSTGDRIFISGGAGGVGTFAIQIAKHLRSKLWNREAGLAGDPVFTSRASDGFHLGSGKCL